MKKIKIFILLLGVIFFSTSIPAKAVSLLNDSKQNINIIYIHGSYETKEAFNSSVNNVHDDMIKAFESDQLIYKRLLNCGKKRIGRDPLIYFWADLTKDDLKVIDKVLAKTKEFSSRLAQFGRATLSHTLHDAIWVSKPSNSRNLLTKLNDMVKEENQKGNEVILYGYSAGSLIASQYMTNRLPIIDINKLYYDNSNSYTGRFFSKSIKEFDFKPTCLDALKESKLVFYTDNDEFVTNPSIDYLKETLPKLDKYTELYCSPQGTLKGVVVFGTPLTTFDSSIPKEGSQSNLLAKMLVKYLIENDIFFLSVNYASDFIAMPLPKQPTYKELKNIKYIDEKTKTGGFVYDNSSVKSFNFFFSAHLAYWNNGRKFAKAIVDSYNKGFKYFYGLN